MSCEVGKYKTVDADTACDGICPTNSTSPAASEEATDCVCVIKDIAGYMVVIWQIHTKTI